MSSPPRKRFRSGSAVSIEPVLDASVTSELPLCNVFVAEILDRKLTSKLIQTLTETNSYLLAIGQHLKRVKSSKVDGKQRLFIILGRVDKFFDEKEKASKWLECSDDGCVDPVYEKCTNCVCEKQDGCRCTMKPLTLKLNDIKDKLLEKGVDCDLYGLDQRLYKATVTATKPVTRQQYRQSALLWPTNFHEDKYLEALLCGNVMDVDTCLQWLSLARQFGGAVVVKPDTNQLIATAECKMGLSCQSKARLAHALKHPCMLAIDRVSRKQGGGCWKETMDETDCRDNVIKCADDGNDTMFDTVGRLGNESEDIVCKRKRTVEVRIQEHGGEKIADVDEENRMQRVCKEVPKQKHVTEYMTSLSNQLGGINEHICSEHSQSINQSFDAFSPLEDGHHRSVRSGESERTDTNQVNEQGDKVDKKTKRDECVPTKQTDEKSDGEKEKTLLKVECLSSDYREQTVRRSDKRDEGTLKGSDKRDGRILKEDDSFGSDERNERILEDHSSLTVSDKQTDRKSDRENELVMKEDDYLCTGYDFYIIREPCVMCSMALLHSRVRRVIYSESDPLGSLGSLCNVHLQRGFNHHFEVFRVKTL